jgi:hypothetical protein
VKINSYCRHAGLMNEYVKYISDIKLGIWTCIVSKCSSVPWWELFLVCGVGQDCAVSDCGEVECCGLTIMSYHNNLILFMLA